MGHNFIQMNVLEVVLTFYSKKTHLFSFLELINFMYIIIMKVIYFIMDTIMYFDLNTDYYYFMDINCIMVINSYIDFKVHFMRVEHIMEIVKFQVAIPFYLNSVFFILSWMEHILFFPRFHFLLLSFIYFMEPLMELRMIQDCINQKMKFLTDMI